MKRIEFLAWVLGMLALGAQAIAQDRVVQQPAWRQFRVGTSLSVPDGGRAVLGGVGSAATGSKRYGPLPNGSSWGGEYSHTSQSVSVYIHDFEAADRALLDAAQSRRAKSEPQLNPRAAHAWKTLQARHTSR